MFTLQMLHKLPMLRRLSERSGRRLVVLGTEGAQGTLHPNLVGAAVNGPRTRERPRVVVPPIGDQARMSTCGRLAGLALAGFTWTFTGASGLVVTVKVKRT